MRRLLVASLVAVITCGASRVARAEGTAPVLPATATVAPMVLSQLDAAGHPHSEEGQNGFSFRRVRLGVWSSPADWLFALASVELTAPETPTIIDGFVTIVPLEALRLTAGFSRNPLFVSARSELEGTTPLPELSMPTRALWPGRDLGIEAHLIADALPLEAWLRVGNGVNSPLGKATTDSATLAYSARLDATAGRARFRPDAAEALGMRVGAGAYFEQTADRAGIGGTTASGYAFYLPPTVAGSRTIVEGHALVYAGPVRALVEAGAALENRSTSVSGAGGGARLDLDPAQSRGASVEVSWMITGQHRVAGAWPIHDDDRRFAFDHVGVEVAARAERLDLGRQTRDLPRGGASGASLASTCWLSDALSVGVAGYLYSYDVAPIDQPGTTSSWLVQSRLTLYLNPPPAAYAQTRADDAHRRRP